MAASRRPDEGQLSVFRNEGILTPTPFMADNKDFNVPLLNSKQMYQAIRSWCVATEPVIYPGEFYGIKRPSFLKDLMQRWLAWLYTRLLTARYQ